MRILQVHNYYKQAGGEDAVIDAESSLLSANGQEVKLHTADNRSLIKPWRKFMAGWQAVYSISARECLARVLEEFEPHIVHVHNFFPLLTPSIYDVCQAKGTPVVQTLHNYRLICPGAFLMRSGQVCEDCVAASAYQSIRHGCYRGSVLGTLAVARMLESHRRLKTWRNKVDRFIALTNFAKYKFVEGGLPIEKIVVKPNFVFPGQLPSGAEQRRRGALFVGRLSREKGIDTLLKAWRSLDIPLVLLGGGPLAATVAEAGLLNVIAPGQQPGETVMSAMRKASFLVMPSECYETFGLVIIEAFAQGLPVIASRLGAMAELVEDGVTGLHFEAGDPEDLERKARWMLEHPTECRRMGENARRAYEEKYTPERNYQLLMNIYREAIDEKKKGHQRRH